jgi:hypothetical protein
MRRQQDFLFSVMLMAAVTAPACGQTPMAAAGPSNSAAASSIPDFSGMWVHVYWPGFEPPATGPSPVTNRERLHGGPQKGVSNPVLFVGEYASPILKPPAAEAVKKQGELELSGVGGPTPSNQCWPEPVPYIFSNLGIQLLQQPDKITILYGRDHQVRHIRINQPHPARVAPSWYGDSVGHYEGDVLVVDTVGIKAGRFSMIDMFGTPYTPALHVVERYQLLDYEVAKEGLERAAKENFRLPPEAIASAGDSDPNYRGKHLQLQFTVEDEGVFRMPWSATVTYGHAIDNGHGVENVCAENIKYSPGQDAAVPIADKPDF